MRRHITYAKYVLRHKWYVFQECRKLDVPLLVAIFHDWDKFLTDEWFAYANTFYKPDGTKQYVPGIAFARAWLLHQHRNKHHWQNWLTVDGFPLPETNVLVWDKGNAQEIVERETVGGIRYELRDVAPERIGIRKMPELFAREMLADWRGAGRALGFPDTNLWYLENKGNIKLHPETRMFIEHHLIANAYYEGNL